VTAARFRASIVLVPILVVLALSGCAGTSPGAASTPTPSATTAGPCTEVTVIVEFTTLDHKPITACAPAGVAADVLKAAKLSTAGTTDYGNQVICRVDDLPSPDAESCATLPSAAYWAMWIKSSADAKWEYAQEGVATQQLADGQFLGLRYTTGNDTTGDGSSGSRYRTVAKGVAVVNNGNDVVLLRGGSYNETMTITKALTLRATRGNVVVGQ